MSPLDPELSARLRTNAEGLVPVVVTEHSTGDVLMLAWMDEEALERTISTGRATYWSRSRREYWVKGETSGHHQRVREIRLDCDNDAILLLVEQAGGIACHTGRERCFYQKLDGGQWTIVEPVLKDPEAIYGRE